MTDIPEPEALEQAQERRRERKVAKKKHAAARNAFLEESSGFIDREALRHALERYMEREGLDFDGAPEGAGPAPRAAAMGAPAPMAFPANNINRWNPIGPSVVRRGQAADRPRVSGRVRDLVVSNDGRRAYAGTAKGGIWYTDDGGATWEPLGGWASEPRRQGGIISAFSCGCLLVSFGAAAANDFVMVGTGEFVDTPALGPDATNAISMGGMGILVATGPAAQTVQTDSWESATGINALERVSIVRMVRVPGSVAGQNGDRVIAATSAGLFMGTRSMVGGSLAFSWLPLSAPPRPASPPSAALPAAPATWATNHDPTDLVYVGNRLFVCYRGAGVAVSDNNGTNFRWVNMTFAAAAPVATSRLVGRMSLAVNDDGNRVYVLGEVNTTPGAAGNLQIPHVWQIANPSVAAPASPTATPLNNAPNNGQLWPGQRDYDQAIVVTTRTTAAGPPAVRTDRVYIGGSLVGYVNNLNDWNASIWAFDVNGANLVPSPGVSDIPAATTHGANIAGLVGNNVHPDVHALRKAVNADGSSQIWVACDGGVFVSLRNGQTNTFASRNVGLASIESGFVASHPSSSHFAMLGCQDNGRQVRVGDTVWEMKSNMSGDGGGVIFHPVQSHYVMGQFAFADWACDPRSRYVQPAVPPNANNPTGSDAEYAASSFYSGVDVITQPAGNRARVALGTNRVWVTDNLGTSNPNTWRVLPITAAGVFANSRDPRPGNRLPSTPANMAFGVPPGMGSVITVKWVNPTTLLALYQRGVIRYQQNAASQWTSTTLLSQGMAAPAAPFVNLMAGPTLPLFTDIAPVPGTSNFYLVCTGQTGRWRPAVPATPTTAAVAATSPTPMVDSCFYYDSTGAGGFRTTGLGGALRTPGVAASPVDPAYSVIVDPTNVNNVYVGTATGVWSSTRAGNAHGPWQLFANGLPESTVQDLHIWTDPAGAAGSPRLLRAALQSRGVWEVNLAAQEPTRTYVRVHERDDRRMFPTPMKNPRRRPAASNVVAYRSPDIVIRPETPVTNTPSFRGTNLTNGALTYQLWTFQTAFRWLYPSVIPDGRWTDQFGDLVERHRRTLGLPNAGSRRVDAALWNSVMANGQDENGRPGVYRAPWQNALAPNLPGSEIDLMETVIPRRDSNNVWQVYRERSKVDILLHHRDTRPVTNNNAYAVLLWRHHTSTNTLMGTDCTNIVAYVRSLLTAAPAATPAGWNVALTGGNALHRLSVPLAARMPRAISANIDLTAVPSGRRVLLLAIVGSSADPFSAVPSGPIDRVDRFVRNWPHAAARLISVWRRPGTQLF